MCLCSRPEGDRWLPVARRGPCSDGPSKPPDSNAAKPLPCCCGGGRLERSLRSGSLLHASGVQDGCRWLRSERRHHRRAPPHAHHAGVVCDEFREGVDLSRCRSTPHPPRPAGSGLFSPPSGEKGQKRCRHRLSRLRREDRSSAFSARTKAAVRRTANHDSPKICIPLPPQHFAHPRIH